MILWLTTVCMEQFIEYCKADLIDEAVIAFIAVSPPWRYRRSAHKNSPSQMYRQRRHLSADIKSKHQSQRHRPRQSSSWRHMRKRRYPRLRIRQNQKSLQSQSRPNQALSSSPAPDAMEVDAATVLPINDAVPTQEIKPDAEISDDDDLFGEKAEPASGISPPRY